MKVPRTSLDQWFVLQAVVDAEGFAQAAQRLHRSQSAVSKLQEQLGVKLLALDRRRARLTEAGTILLEHSRRLIQDACELEKMARELDQGWETEVRLAVDRAFPTPWLVEALRQFAEVGRGTRVKLQEVVLSGAILRSVSSAAEPHRNAV